MEQQKYDLEERLLAFGADVIRFTESLHRSRAGNHIGGQLLRSGTSPLLNHGEAQAAESKADFIHKMKVSLKELRESERALRLIGKVPLTDDLQVLKILQKETDELIRIFVASIRTANSSKVREGSGCDYDADGSSIYFDVQSSMFDVGCS